MKIGELLEHFHGDNWIRIHDRHLYKTSVYKRCGVLEKYGNCNGKLQEKEGHAVAREILENLDYKNINRILFLIGHHHTYINVSGLDYQILIEADLLVNFEEENTSKEDIKKVYENIFKTKTGKEFCREIFDISP